MDRAVMIQKVKMLVDESASDELIDLYLDMITQRVMNYCHRQDMPVELEYVVIDMVAAYFNLKLNPNKAGGEGGITVGKAKAITRGDTRIEYATSGDLGGQAEDGRYLDQGVRAFVENYERQLNAFRKLVSR